MHLLTFVSNFKYSKMKKARGILLLFILASTLCACPYSSPYNLDNEPTIYVENVLLGNWLGLIQKEGSLKQESVKVTLSKKTDTEYNISVTGYLEDLKPFRVVKADSINGTAFMSTVDDMQFLNINIQSRIYIAELKFKDDKLSMLPLAEHFTGKMIFNSEALRNSVSFHYKTRVHPILADEFCLRDMIKQN